MASIYMNNVKITMVGFIWIFFFFAKSFDIFLHVGAIVFCMMTIFWELSLVYGKNSERQSHGKKLS